MFTEIAPRYDFLNHLLSLQMDRVWRSRTARRLRPIMQRRDARVLDLCCGTGDLAFALARSVQHLWSQQISRTPCWLEQIAKRAVIRKPIRYPPASSAKPTPSVSKIAPRRSKYLYAFGFPDSSPPIFGNTLRNTSDRDSPVALAAAR